MAFEQKRQGEVAIVRLMIRLYCRKHHRQAEELCEDCVQLADYAQRRIELCPNMTTKTFCSACSTPCYRPDMRARIREVMRYAGPRMLFHHPLTTLRHFLLSRKH